MQNLCSFEICFNYVLCTFMDISQYSQNDHHPSPSTELWTPPANIAQGQSGHSSKLGLGDGSKIITHDRFFFHTLKAPIDGHQNRRWMARWCRGWGQEVGDSWVRDESLRRRGRWWKLPFIPNFSTSSLPTLRCVPTSVCLQTWLQPHSHQGRRLPGGEGSPKSVPVGFHLDIYPRPLFFRPGGEFIVGSRANIPPPARQQQQQATVLGFQLEYGGVG